MLYHCVFVYNLHLFKRSNTTMRVSVFTIHILAYEREQIAYRVAAIK